MFTLAMASPLLGAAEISGITITDKSDEIPAGDKKKWEKEFKKPFVTRLAEVSK